MDGLDVYIDDYSKPDPLPPGWLEKMAHTAYLGIYKPPEPAEAPEKPADAAAQAESPVETTPSEALSQDPAPEPAAEAEKREAP